MIAVNVLKPFEGDEAMDLFFIFIVLCPIFLVISLLYLIISFINRFKMKQRFLSNYNLLNITIILFTLIILITYYFPIEGIYKNSIPEFVTVQIKNKNFEIKDQDTLLKLLEIINDNTYVRNASDSLIDIRFPSENLIRIDMVYSDNIEISKVVHIYILYSVSEEQSNKIEISSKSTLQINEQFFRIPEYAKISKDIYNLIVNSKEFLEAD